MIKRFRIKCIAVLISLCVVVFNVIAAETKGVKTSYKNYSIFTYGNDDVLCEPYTVNKDDWLYKIFRKKGEISEKDFPHFLIIFKKINPDISNIDAIEPGDNILIPLKKVKKQDYEQSSPGTISVPVIEFSATPEDLDLKPFVKEHKLKRGETVSTLIDKDFLEKTGNLTEEGLKAFQLANPNIKNINIVYEGTQIYLPDPAIKSEPWFRSLFSSKIDREPDQDRAKETLQHRIQTHELAQLKKYASLIGGTLLNSGQMYFPGIDGTGRAIDLAQTPMIETEDGSKILIISGNTVNRDLLKHIQDHWRNLKLQTLSESVSKLKHSQTFEERKNRTLEYKKMIKQVLGPTEYDYLPNAKIPFNYNKIQLEAKFGRVVREDSVDLLINFGNVYGSALEIIEKKEYEIISITSKLSVSKALHTLFIPLGYTIRENPSFLYEERVKTLKGLYIEKPPVKLFIPFEEIPSDSHNFLKMQNINIVLIDMSLLKNEKEL